MTNMAESRLATLGSAVNDWPSPLTGTLVVLLNWKVLCVMSANDGVATRAMASTGSTSIDFEFIRHSLLLSAAGEEAITNVLGLGTDALSKPRRRRRNICHATGLNMRIACVD